MSKGTDPWRTDIENELAHQQCALVVQDHGVDEAKVVGLSCWSYIVLMGSMDCLSALSRTHASTVVYVVPVMIHARHRRRLLSETSKRGADCSSGNESQQRTHGEQPDMHL